MAANAGVPLSLRFRDGLRAWRRSPSTTSLRSKFPADRAKYGPLARSAVSNEPGIRALSTKYAALWKREFLERKQRKNFQKGNFVLVSDAHFMPQRPPLAALPCYLCRFSGVKQTSRSCRYVRLRPLLRNSAVRFCCDVQDCRALTAAVSGWQCRHRGGRSLQVPDHPAGV
jgi:hypothetical protein